MFASNLGFLLRSRLYYTDSLWAHQSRPSGSILEQQSQVDQKASDALAIVRLFLLFCISMAYFLFRSDEFHVSNHLFPAIGNTQLLNLSNKVNGVFPVCTVRNGSEPVMIFAGGSPQNLDSFETSIIIPYH